MTYGEMKKLLNLIHVILMRWLKIKGKNGCRVKIFHLIIFFIRIGVIIDNKVDFTIIISKNWPNFNSRVEDRTSEEK